MDTVFEKVRAGDVLLAAGLTALGVALTVGNVLGNEEGARIDSHSWWSVPVFALATVAVLWRRRSILAVCAVAAVALGVHVLAFGWLVRCGAGLPLAFALAYGVGRLSRGWGSAVGLLLTLGIQVLVLVEDSAAGSAILPFTALIGVVAWGIGVWVQRRVEPGAPVHEPVPASAAA